MTSVAYLAFAIAVGFAVGAIVLWLRHAGLGPDVVCEDSTGRAESLAHDRQAIGKTSAARETAAIHRIIRLPCVARCNELSASADHPTRRAQWRYSKRFTTRGRNLQTPMTV